MAKFRENRRISYVIKKSCKVVIKDEPLVGGESATAVS